MALILSEDEPLSRCSWVTRRMRGRRALRSGLVLVRYSYSAKKGRIGEDEKDR